MANFIKIRDLAAYSENAAGVVTGIYTGDYMALASRLPGNGGLESIENTRRATIGDVIRIYNEAQTIADALAAAPEGTTEEEIGQALAGPETLPVQAVVSSWDPTALASDGGVGDCRVTNDPALTARTFDSVLQVGGGLTYSYYTGEPADHAHPECAPRYYTLGLTPATDVGNTTFVLFIGRNEYLDDAANYGAGVLANWQATDNALTDVEVSTSSTVKATGNYLLYNSGGWNSAGALVGWYETSWQGPTWSGVNGGVLGANVAVVDAVNTDRALISSSKILESGVMDSTSTPGSNEVRPMSEILAQVHGLNSFTAAKCVANPFVSLDAATRYAAKKFDLGTSTIIYWIRGDGPQGNRTSLADYSAVNHAPVGMQKLGHYQQFVVSPVAGKPRKINYDFGPKTSNDVTLPYNPVGNSVTMWHFGDDNLYSHLTNVHFKFFGMGQSQAITKRKWYLFRYGSTVNLWWNNSIVDWSDYSNVWPAGYAAPNEAVAYGLHQPYGNASVNFDSSFALASSGMRVAVNVNHGIADYDDYSRFRPSVEYMTNRKVNLGTFMECHGDSILRNYTFAPNNYSVGGGASMPTSKWCSSSIHAWQRFRDGTDGVDEGVHFSLLQTLNGAAWWESAQPLLCNSSTYRDKSYFDYGATNNGNVTINIDPDLVDSVVPFKPTTAGGFGDMLISTGTFTQVNDCTGYQLVPWIPTGTASNAAFNFLGGEAFNGSARCLREASPTTSILGNFSNFNDYPATSMALDGTDGWAGRVTGGYPSTLINGHGAVPGTADGSGPLSMRCTGLGIGHVENLIGGPNLTQFPIFSGMSWADNTTVKYLDDPYPFYTTHLP